MAQKTIISKETAQYCYIDIDIDEYRQKLANGAAFVNATDTRYGFTSTNLFDLGGSELSRVKIMHDTDHEWSNKDILVQHPIPSSRIVVQLHWDTAPLACENFATLCNNASVKQCPIGESGKPLTYKNSIIHRVQTNFVIQGGDFVFGNGSGGECIYGKNKFKDEKFGLQQKHDKRGILGMGNSGKNSNSSQFYITFGPIPQCNGKHVIFGQVISGWDVIDYIEKYASTDTGIPKVSICITDCGIWNYKIHPGSGYWYDQPDSESYTGISPLFIVRPRIAVIVPNDTVYTKFHEQLQSFCDLVKVEYNTEVATTTVTTIQSLLQKFAIDIVIVAPACRSIIEEIKVPTTDSYSTTNNTIIEAKPLDVVTKVRTESWIGQHENWRLDR